MAGQPPSPTAIEAEKLRRQLKKARTDLANVPEHVEEEGEGNWLVAYADMMTLLFGFFVILSAFSTPNAQKIEELKRETSKALGGKYVKPYGDLTDGLRKTLKEVNLDKDVVIEETEEGVTLTSRGALFFDSGSAVMKPQAQNLMEHVAVVLAKEAKGFRIVVEGHTDNVPMVSRDFPSNWELSSIRAGSVVRLLEGSGISRQFLRPVGLADTEPVAPNSPGGIPNATNQAINRRIVVKILKQLPSRM
ncbi:MAG: flagellar motor protein MotB [Bdellovibrionota bacterium]